MVNPVLLSGRLKPSLQLNFLSGLLDSRITYTNATANRTYYNSSGVLSYAAANTPRFDYNPSTLAVRGLLIEEGRTNLILRSEEQDSASWSKQQASVSANAIASPNGTTTADSIIEDSSSATHGANQSYSGNSATVYTMTLYAKAGTRSWLRLTLNDTGGNSCQAWFNLGSGAVGTVSNSGTGSGATASIESLINGWYRCRLTGTPSSASSGTVRYEYRMTTADNTTTYLGDGASNIYIWGAQLEAGAFPTSYIATTSATVARAADVATIGTLTPWYNASEGTLFIQAIPAGQTALAAYLVCFDDNSTNEMIANYYILTNKLGSLIQDNGVLLLAIQNTSAITTLAVNKTAFAFKLNNFAASANGGSVQTSSSGTMPTPDRLRFGNRADSARPFTGWLQAVRYYPARLPNSTLQSLTS